MKLYIDNIEVTYEANGPAELPVLRQCRLVLSSGEPTVLLGPNGSGKTTLLRVLSGDLKPTAGEIGLLESGKRHRCTQDELRSRVEFVKQDPLDGLFPSLSLGENLALRLDGSQRSFLDPYRRSKHFRGSEEAFSALAPLYQRYRRRRLMTLSVGERQLFAIALAQFRSRAIVLLDEPTAALDLSKRALVEDRLKSWLGNDDIISLVVTHEEHFADRLGFQRIDLMKINLPL